MDTRTLDSLQGELERLFDLNQMINLSVDGLGFEPEWVGDAQNPSAFARALVSYCHGHDALPALIDAIMLSSDHADAKLPHYLGQLSHGELTPGTAIDNFRVVKKLGEEDLSVIYLAELEHDGEIEKAALKVIRPEYARDPAAVQRYTTASRFLRKLDVRGLLPIKAVGKLHDSRPWVAAAHVDGQTLAERLRTTGALHINEALPVFQDLMEGLATLHDRGLIHGDIKVENVLLVSGEHPQPRALWLDAGTDRLLAHRSPQSGMLPVRTPKAVSPEQARGSAPNARSEIYALGVLLYETLTGAPPFTGASAIDVVASHLRTAPKPPSGRARRGTLNSALDEVILKTLAKEPKDRFGTVRQVAEALSSAAAKRPSQSPLDESHFAALQLALLAAPGDSNHLQALITAASEADAHGRAAAALVEVADQTTQPQKALPLYVRAAQLYTDEALDLDAAKAAYQKALKRQNDHGPALQGLEVVYRKQEDAQGLIDILKERAERTQDKAQRIQILCEVGATYLHKLHKPLQAARTYTTTLILDPLHEEARAALVAAGHANQQVWAEVLPLLSAEANERFGQAINEIEPRHWAAERTVADAREQRIAIQTRLDSLLAQREEAKAQELQRLRDQADRHDPAHRKSQPPAGTPEQRARLMEANDAIDEANQQMVVLDGEIAVHHKTTEQAHAAAEAQVETYEEFLARCQAADASGPSPEIQAELAELEQEANSLVEQAARLAEGLEPLQARKRALQTQLDQLAAEVEALNEELFNNDDAETRVLPPNDELIALIDAIEALEQSEVTLTEAEWGELDQADAQVVAAEQDLARIAQLRAATSDTPADPAKIQAQAEAIALRTLLGDLYHRELERHDLALAAYEEAVALEPEHEPALDGLASVYRHEHNWSALSELQMQRAERCKSRAEARGFHTAAARIMIEELQDLDQARLLLSTVLAEDPSADEAQALLHTVLHAQQDYEALREHLQQRLPNVTGAALQDTHLQLARLGKPLDDESLAVHHYQALLELAPSHREAATGLCQLAEQLGDVQALALGLRAELEHASTPKQRIQLLERLAALAEDEFMDLQQAAECFEQIHEILGTHSSAHKELPRLYKALDRPEDAAKLLVHDAEHQDDPTERCQRWVEAAHLLEDLDAKQALSLCERVLRLDSEHHKALALAARIYQSRGDIDNAISTLERLVEHVDPGPERARHLLKLGRTAEQAQQPTTAAQYYLRALEEDEQCIEAASRLRAIYTEQGDIYGAVDMLRRTLSTVDSDLRRTQLLGELGLLYVDKLGERDLAREALTEALSLDPSNALAAAAMGQVAMAEEAYAEATDYFAVALNRLQALPEDVAIDTCVDAGEALLQQERLDEAIEAFRKARTLEPLALRHRERYADTVLLAGRPAEAVALYSDLLDSLGSTLLDADKQRLLVGLSNAQRAAGQAEAALQSLMRAQELGHSDAVLRARTESHLDLAQYREAFEATKERLEYQDDPDSRFDLLVQAGELLTGPLQDSRGAAKYFAQAADIQPGNRRLITKLMGVYSELEEWSALLALILRSAASVEKPAEVAKYYATAGSIAADKLKRYSDAATHYETALAQLPLEENKGYFKSLCECLARAQAWERLEDAYRVRYEQVQASPSPLMPTLADLLEQRAQVLRQNLDRTTEAVALLEEAVKHEPNDTRRRNLINRLYHQDLKRYWPQVIQAHRRSLRDRPDNIVVLKAMRKVYTSAKRPDESWCLCQALRLLDGTDADEERFFKKYRLTRLPRFRNALTDELLRTLVMHPAQDPLLTAMFAAMTPAITTLQCRPLTNFGLDTSQAVTAANDHTAMGRMLSHASESLGIPLPAVFHRPQDPSGLSFLFSQPPALGIGQGASVGGPQQALAFVAARHSSYYRAGHIPRQLIPTGTGLRTWLMAAIRLVMPSFSVPSNLEGQVNECFDAIQRFLNGPQQDLLRSMTQKLVKAAPELNLHRWMAGVDLTADRLGFVLSNDLKLARAVIEASPEDSAAVSRSERQRELFGYACSESYFELRKKLGIALGG